MLSSDVHMQLDPAVILRDEDHCCFHPINGCVVQCNPIGYLALAHFVEPCTPERAALTISTVFNVPVETALSDLCLFLQDLLRSSILVRT